MSTTGYCSFKNTLKKLENCRDHIKDSKLDTEEIEARVELIRCCMGLLEDLGMEVDEKM